MKLRNKKTGEIVDLTEGHICETDCGSLLTISPVAVLDKSYNYNSLAELNEEWEDCEEFEGYFVDAVGNVTENSYADIKMRKNFCKQLKQIGNYFETKKEAEKAVEKLKAWKRLRDSGFEFVGLSYSSSNEVYFEFVDEPLSRKQAIEAEKDLNLLFGGEE